MDRGHGLSWWPVASASINLVKSLSSQRLCWDTAPGPLEGLGVWGPGRRRPGRVCDKRGGRVAAPNRDPARVRGTRALRGWGSSEDPHRDPGLSRGTAGIREGARKTRKGCPEAEPRQAPPERISCVSRRSQENPDRGRTALGCSKLCLRLPSGPWQRLPSADGTELASLSPGKQWPEETVSTWPRAPVSGHLNPRAQQPGPGPGTRRGP